MIDLNELPPDLNEVPRDINDQRSNIPNGGHNVESPCYTQPGLGHIPTGHVDVGGPSLAPSIPVVVSLRSESHTLDETGTEAAAAGPTETELRAGGVDGVVHIEEGDDEAGSQPMEPYVGMRFDSLQIAKDHYNSYALRMGFSIKMNTSRRSAYTNILEKQQFVCNRNRKAKVDDGRAESAPILDPIPDPEKVNGEEENDDEPPVFNEEETDPKKKTKKRKRETIKQTECKAKMLVKLIDGRWEVTHFVRDHNHALVNKPSLSKYLRSHQGIPPDEAEFLRILYNCNLSRGRMMHVMSEFYGSELMVPYGPKAITNLCSTFRKDDTKEGDLIETIAHFKEIQKTDPDFFYKVKYDEEDRVVNLFWVDGVARKAYAEAYHDCISFDTTYMTNMYNMPFAPFIGINRHGQSFMLGCAFVRQELASSFDWVFQTFLEAMNGKAPDNFITDQDVAMKQSIESIFPTTVHRCCRWHIMKKAQEKVGWLLCRNPGLSEDFNYCVDFSFTPEEFEQNWAGLMMKYEAITNTHFEKLYEYRATWVPCYFKYRFFPFLQSTQRSEGFNAVLKRYVNPHYSILNFVKQYEKIQTHILAKEGCNDYRTEHLQVELWSRFPIERQAYDCYTRDLYRKFREEFEMIGRYNDFQVAAQLYELRPNQETVAKYGPRIYLVEANVGQGLYSCECCKMQRDGILCCHILKVFTHLGVDIIPAHYILRRWTPLAVPSAPGTGYQPPDEMPPQSKKQIRERNMTADFRKLAQFASGSDATEAIVRKHMRAARTEITHLNKSKKKKKPTTAPVPSNDANPRGPPPPPGRATQPGPTGSDLPTARSSFPPPNAPTSQASTHARQGPLAQDEYTNQSSPPVPPGPVGQTDSTFHSYDVVPRDPPRSTTKGRAKSRRYHSALELHPKKKNKCSHCGSTEHTAGHCLQRLR